MENATVAKVALVGDSVRSERGLGEKWCSARLASCLRSFFEGAGIGATRGLWAWDRFGCAGWTDMGAGFLS